MYWRSYTITPADIRDKRIVRKVDLRVALWAFIMFFSLDLDRGNLSQANSDNFLDDLNMNTDDFNLGNTLFRVQHNLLSESKTV